jgi:hypothetical protein
VKGVDREGLNMLMITTIRGARPHGGTAFRRTHEARLRERYHRILRLPDGRSGPEMAPWMSRDEATGRAWVHAFNEAGLWGLERAPIPVRPM